MLARVGKPIQYVGGELNSVVKDWASVDVRWCLCYPDAYEVGQPNQGVAILYEILNEQDWILAERTYAVWADLEALMREHGVPQFTLDAHRPVADFDVLGFSFATELGYTNMLNTLDLAGVAIHAADRREDDPIVLAGGHAAFNPEPVADFLDAAVLGDGEQIVVTISETVRDVEGRGPPRWPGWPAAPAGRRRRGLRAQVLRRGLPAGRADPPGRPQPRRGCRSGWPSTP